MKYQPLGANAMTVLAISIFIASVVLAIPEHLQLAAVSAAVQTAGIPNVRTAISSPLFRQTNQSLRARAFVLEGNVALDNPRLSTTRDSVSVVRNGQTLKLYPGDELQEGDRVYRGGKGVNQFEWGGSIAIYDSYGSPVAIIGNNHVVDFKLSRFRYANASTIRIEVLNLSGADLRGEASSIVQEGELVLEVKNPDGIHQKKTSESSQEQADLELGRYRPGGAQVRWERATQIYTMGRAGAKKEYSQMSAEHQQQYEAAMHPRAATQTAAPVKQAPAVTPAVKPCNANEVAVFAQLTGSWKGWRTNVTINGSCAQASGEVMWAEYCEGIDAPYNQNLTRYHGTFEGRVVGRSLMVSWVQPAVSPHPRTTGSATCSIGSDGSLICSGFGCAVNAKRQ